MMEPSRSSLATTGRVLVVADWTTDAATVIAECRHRPEQVGATLGLVVPARLHGLDWVGGPSASVPCAERQLDSIGRLAASAGLRFHAAAVGDPDLLAGIWDAVADGPPTSCCSARAAGASPSRTRSISHRARRLTGLAASRLELPATPAPRFAQAG
jgi:hypothetical protein